MAFFQSLGRWLSSLGVEGPRFGDPVITGNERYLKQDYDGAIADYTDALRLDPRNFAAIANRGAAYYCKGQHDQAIADYTDALRIDPSSLFAYSGRGMALLAKGDFDRAIADFTVALQIDSRDASGYLNRGTAWYYKHEYDRSLDDYNDAIHFDPHSAYAYCNRGCVYLAKQERARVADGAYQADQPKANAPIASTARAGYERALDDFYEAIRLDPKYAWSYCGRGATWHCLEEYAKALDDYTESIRLDPKFVLAYVNRAHAHFEQKQYSLARADYEAGLRIAPNDLWAIHGLAWLLCSALDANVRDGKRAVELAKHVLGLDQGYPEVWLDTLAAAYAECGEFELAVNCQEQALTTALPAFVSDMRERLALYRANQPYRQHSKRSLMTHFMPAKAR